MTNITKELAEALQDLLDEQNGAPLLRREQKWNEAIRKSRAALASYHSQAEGDGWMPIETAPKDGTPILAWDDEYGARETRSITYTPGSTGFAEGLTDRWWEWLEPKGNWAFKWKPTHWRPLPAAPSLPSPNGEKQGAACSKTQVQPKEASNG